MRGNSQNGGQTTKSLLIKPQCSGVPIQQAVSLSSSFPRHCLLFVCAFSPEMPESARSEKLPLLPPPAYKTAPASCNGNRGGSLTLWVLFSGAQHRSTGVQFFEVLVISVFRGLSVHFSERFFQADHRFFDDLCLAGRAIRKLFGHPAVKHRLCFFDFNAQQLVR